MDKSLKKLSRVELLELLIALSEEYDDLVDENERLKKMVAAQRLPRSTKVGSIAEAALQANRYFEVAQRSADDYLREIKHLRDELSARAAAQGRAPAVDGSGVRSRQAEQQSQALLRRAQEQAAKIISQANSRASAIVADAHNRAEEAVAAADERSRALVQQAEREAARIRGQAEPRKAVFGAGGERQEVPGVRPPLPSSTADIVGRARHSRPASGRGAI